MSMFPGVHAAQEVPVQGVPAQGINPNQAASGMVAPQEQVAQEPQLHFGDVNPEKFDLDGLDQVLPPQVIQDLAAQHQAVMNHHIAQLQSRLDANAAQVSQQYQAQLAQLQQRNAQLEAAIERQVLANKSPEEAQAIKLRIEQHKFERERQAFEQTRQLEQQAIQVQQDRVNALNFLSERWGVPVNELADTNSFDEAQERAIYLHHNRRNMVPAHQMNQGPSGGAGAPFRVPSPDSPEFDDLVDIMAGRTPRSSYRQPAQRPYQR